MLVETFTELRDQMASQMAICEMTPELRHRIFLGSKGRKRLEEILGEALVGIARNATSENKTLREVTGAVMSACFSIIAILNARRKDEIQHRALGLNRASLAPVDQGLALYQCRFYIEKTHKGYLSFYVGHGTVQAIELLNRLSDLTQDFVAMAKGPSYSPLEPAQRSLFQIPLLHFRATDKPAYLKFSTTEAAADLLRAALGDHGDVRVSAHMFRRAYALIFIYRYEHGDLMALSQQLGHFDLEMTRHYVTDGLLQTGSVTSGSFAQRSPDEFESWQEEIADLRKEIHTVSMERLEALVGEVIDGKENYSGIFVNLVKRFHQIHGRSIKYKAMGPEDQARALTKSLDERGHAFVPNRHGSCLASSTRRNIRAACYSRAEGVLDRAEASAHVCGGCPYHLVSQAHVRNLESDALGLELSLAVAPKESVVHMVGTAKLKNLRRWIHLHKERMGMNMGQAYAAA
ncbi:hypothetical protein J2W35_006427 [Variovorax boronicumulans]|uniref:hypothetical protein n=1 Tax=Variovorax boronicumulans TaxID=436515 RepID=UPI00277EC763|nr:hypothetical protein [Variovorax boronicumulans]MDQ0086046.1 hypothetical protein [Variovorax boronicumulans]